LLCKLAFAQPRPYWVDARVRPYSREFTFGLPSSHAQNAVSVWSYLAGLKHGAWRWATALALVAMISLSRVYLGVHFGSDVVVGGAIGGLALFLLLRYEPTLESSFERRSFVAQIVLVTGSVVVLLALGLLLRGSSAHTLGSHWAGYVAEARSLEPLIGRLGAIWGLGVGWALSVHGGWASAKGPARMRFARWVLGLIGLLFFWKGLTLLLPVPAGAPSLVLRFVRYALMTLWVTYLAPQLFLRFQLAVPDPQPETPRLQKG
jgi:hypothetical protein